MAKPLSKLEESLKRRGLTAKDEKGKMGATRKSKLQNRLRAFEYREGITEAW